MFGKISKISIANFLSAETRLVKKFPFKFGSSSSSDWVLGSTSAPWSKSSVSFYKENSKIYLKVENIVNNFGHGCSPLLLNGEVLVNSVEIENEQSYLLKIDDQFFVFALDDNFDQWQTSLYFNSWDIFDIPMNQLIETTRIEGVAETILNLGHNFEDCAIRPTGMDIPAIWVTLLPDIVGVPVYDQEENATKEPELEEEIINEVIPTEKGEFVCPICWQHFDGKHILSIASHPSLSGDEILGDREMRRFSPTRFDENGNALDAMGLLVPDMACPHCHHRLPLGFTEMPQNIFSVVGAPASGKSYYLSILIQQLKRCLFENFDITFSDQDPEYNIELNAAINRLFSAKTPEQGRIIKTQLTGGVYRRVQRSGQDVDLPKPYIYNLANNQSEGSEKCLVFYDNAGEHFLPVNSTSADFHILHVAMAKSIFFIFDPISNLEFRRKLAGVESVQLDLEDYEPDQQDVILAQMNVKIKKALGHSFASKLDLPFSVIVGKSDVWSKIMDDFDKIENPMRNGGIDLEILDRNSDLTRKFLSKLCPAVVGGAEKLSSNVRYFPVSAFGHKPKTFIDSTGEEQIAPDPQAIDPKLIEIPTIWALSQIAPDLVPHV